LARASRVFFCAAGDKVGGSRPTGQQIERAFFIYRAKIKKIFFSENGRNRRNRVTLGKKSFIYIDLEETQSRNQKRNVTKVSVTSRGQKCVKGVLARFFFFFFWLYINKAASLWQTIGN
jgi:hypothetical protein